MVCFTVCGRGFLDSKKMALRQLVLDELKIKKYPSRYQVSSGRITAHLEKIEVFSGPNGGEMWLSDRVKISLNAFEVKEIRNFINGVSDCRLDRALLMGIDDFVPDTNGY